MKTAIVIVGLALCSCTKTLLLSDGNISKTIKTNGKIEYFNDTIKFTSVKGTHYCFNTSKINVNVK